MSDHTHEARTRADFAFERMLSESAKEEQRRQRRLTESSAIDEQIAKLRALRLAKRRDDHV